MYWLLHYKSWNPLVVGISVFFKFHSLLFINSISSLVIFLIYVTSQFLRVKSLTIEISRDSGGKFFVTSFAEDTAFRNFMTLVDVEVISFMILQTSAFPAACSLV